ncbi:MAG: hypothetical protein AB1779_08225 [Candidatus Thermoplasmatota archaeon]
MKINRERAAEEPYITHRNKQMQDTIGKITSTLKTNAELAVAKAMEEFPDADMSVINEKTDDNFKKSLEPYFPKAGYDGYLTTDGFLINMSSPIVSIGTAPFSHYSPNPFGKIVKMESPVYYRTMGSVEVNITDTKVGGKGKITAKTTIDLDRIVPSSRPFLLDQGTKLEYDFQDDSLIDDMVGYFLEKSLDNGYFSAVWDLNNAIVTDAVNIAIAIDSARIYRHTSNTALDSYLKGKGSIDVFDCWKYLKGYTSGAGDGAIKIDFSKYDKPFEFKSSTDASSSQIKYKVNHVWEQASIGIESNPYIDKENSKKAVVYDISIKGKAKYYVEEVDIHPKGKFDKSIDVDIMLHFGAVRDITWLSTEEIQYENENEFINKFAKLESRRGDVYIIPKNYEDKTLAQIDGKQTVELNIDGIYLGEFEEQVIGNSIYIEKMKIGGHDINIILKYENGSFEAGSNRVDIEHGKTSYVNVYTVPDFTGDAIFWELIIRYANAAPPGKRLYTIGKLFSDLTGYPYNEKEYQTAYDYLKFVNWLEGFNEFLLSDYSKTIETGKKLGLKFVANTISLVAGRVVHCLAKNIIDNVVALGGRIEVIIGEEIIDQQVLAIIFGGAFVIAHYSHTIRHTVDIIVKWQGKILNVDKEITFFQKLNIGLGYGLNALAIITLVLDIHTKIITLKSVCEDDAGLGECAVNIATITLSMVNSFANLAMNIVNVGTLLLKNVFHKIGWAAILSGKVTPLLAKYIPVIGMVISIILSIITITKTIATGDWSALFDVAGNPLEVASFWTGVIMLGMGIAWLVGVLCGVAALQAVPVIGQIVGAVILAIVMIIWVVLNWAKICAWWHGTVTKEDLRKLEGDMSGILENTMNLRARLNGENLYDSLYHARKQKAVGIMAGRIASITNEKELADKMKNIAMYSKEYSTAEYRKALYMSYAKFWVAPLWRQMTDFVDNDHKGDYGSEGFKNTHANPLQKFASWITFGLAKPKEHHHWNSSIYVLFKDGSSRVLGQHKTKHQSIENFLDNIRPATEIRWNGYDYVEEPTENVNWTDMGVNHTVQKIEFKITGHNGEANPRVNSDGTKEWSNTIKPLTAVLEKWVKIANKQNERYTYFGSFPDPSRFSKEYGSIVIAKDTGFKARVTLSKISGSGEMLVGQETVYLPYAFEIGEKERSKHIYIKPGKYSISWSEVPTPELPLLTTGKEVDVKAYSSPDFEAGKAHIGIDWTKVVKFVVENNFANAVGVWVRTADSTDSKHTTVRRDLSTIVKVREIEGIGNPNNEPNNYKYRNAFLMSKGQKKEVWVIFPNEGKHVYLKAGLNVDNNIDNGFEVFNDVFISPGTDRWQSVRIRDSKIPPSTVDISSDEGDNPKLRKLLKEYYGLKKNDPEPTTVTDYVVDFDAKVARNKKDTLRNEEYTYSFSARLLVNYAAGLDHNPKAKIYGAGDSYNRWEAAKRVAEEMYYTVDEIIHYYNEELKTKQKCLIFYHQYLEQY